MSLKPVVRISFQVKSLLQQTLHGTNADLQALSWFCHEINNQ